MMKKFVLFWVFSGERGEYETINIKKMKNIVFNRALKSQK